MFRIKLNFKLKNNMLPRELDRLLVSFLKASAQNYSEEFFDSLYTKERNVIKPFTFSYYLPGAVFDDVSILLNQKEFTMFFSDVDLGQIICFFNAFKLIKFKTYPMNGNSMQLSAVTIQQCNEIKDTEIVVKMKSSLIVRKHMVEDNKDIYYTYDHERFGEAVKENVEVFLDKLELPLSVEDFSIMPVKAKKVVVPVFGRNTDASLGIFKLTGAPELLSVLYMAGIGARRSEGHGYFDIIL